MNILDLEIKMVKLEIRLANKTLRIFTYFFFAILSIVLVELSLFYYHTDHWSLLFNAAYQLGICHMVAIHILNDLKPDLKNNKRRLRKYLEQQNQFYPNTPTLNPFSLVTPGNKKPK